MPRQSNKALEKFNSPTAESIQRKQAKELVDDEFNDIRRQIIRREFDQVGLYNEIFDANREKFGDTLLEFKLMELFRSYINQIGESRRRLGENRPNPFNDLIGAYNAFTSSLSSYVDLAKKQNSRVDVKSYQDELRESAIQLQQLLDYALAMVSGVVPSMPVAAAPAVSAVEAPGLVAEREDRRRRPQTMEQPPPPYEPEWRRNPLLQMPETEPEWRRNPLLPPVPGRGKAHGGNIGDFLKRFAINFALNKRVGQGNGGSLFASREDFYKIHSKKTGGMNTDMIWKFLLGAGKAFGGNKPTEADILELFGLLKEVQRGFVPNQPYKGYSQMTDTEKKRQKGQLGAFEEAYRSTSDFSAAFLDLAEVLRPDRFIEVAPPENGLTYSTEEIQTYKDNAERLIQDFITETSRSEYAQQGEYRPGEKEKLDKMLKDLNRKLNDSIKTLTRYGRGRGKAHGGMKTDTNFGQLVAESEARNPRKKNCHYNTRGFLISCSGKAHGGQAGFSLDKTREIVDQWPGFPYFVPPASKTGPMLDNPRSRVNNRTEANGKPGKRICRKDMSEASIACRKGEDPPKRGRPPRPTVSTEGGKTCVPSKTGKTICRGKSKEGGKKKKAKKSGKPKYDVI